MRIAIDGMLLSRCCSGVEVSIRNLARALASVGREEYVFYAPSRFPEADVTGDRFRTQRVDVPAHVRLVRMLWEQMALPRLLAAGRHDLVHAPGYLAPLRANMPVVVTIYDLIALQYPRWCTVANRLNYRLFLPQSIRKAARIVAPSQTTADAIRSLFPEAASRIRTIHLGIGPEFHVVEDRGVLEKAREHLGLPALYILFVGRHEPKKNLVGLVEAFHGMKSLGSCAHKLVLAGAEGWSQAAVKRRVRELGLQDEVMLPGFVPQDMLPAVYSLASLFVFPSLYEGFGIPPLEAMACGVPVVCSDRGALPEIVGDAALKIDPTNPALMAKALHAALTHRATRKRLIEAGHKRVRFFAWDKMAHAMESLYRDVLAQSRAPRAAGEGLP